MTEFKLEPGDILVTVNRRKDPFSVVKRWAMNSPYDHIFMYLGKVQLFATLCQREIRFPLLFESNGRGVVLQFLSNRYGQEVVILRLKPWYRRRIERLLEEAVGLASEPQAYYDYLCIVQFVLPRLICERLGLPMPLSWHRDPWHTCSEAIFEVFHRAGLGKVIPSNIVPMPGDFVTDSPLLMPVWAGELSDNLVE